MKKVLCILLGLCLLCVTAGCAEKAGPSTEGDDSFVDLTKLSSTMVYAEVYNIMAVPTDYLGKTIKAGGVYQANFYEPTGKYYHAVVIADAAACCAQGLEFEWSGAHTYPDDYPQSGAPIEVTGVFESYEELGNTYYRLTVEEIEVLG